jgi:hypothetical protein
MKVTPVAGGILRALIIGALILATGCSLGGKRASQTPPKPDSEMVVERLVREASGGYRFYVDRIDLHTNKIIQTTEVPEQPYYLLEIPDGRVIFSFTRAPGTFQKKLGELTREGRYRMFMKTVYYSPTPITVYNSQIFIVEGINIDRELSLEVANLKGRSLSYVVLAKSAMVSPAEWFINPNTLQWIVFPSIYGKTVLEEKTKAIKFKLNQKDFLVSPIPIADTSGLIVAKGKENTLFISPGVNKNEPQDSPNYVIKRIDKVTYPEMQLLKSFPMKDQIHEMAYDPASQKLYASMRDGAGIAVIDSKTNTHLYDLPYAAEAIAYVGHQRLAISIANWKIATNGNPELIDAKLILIDTQTDQVVATFEGNYGHIGRDVGLQWDIPIPK